MGDTSGNNEPCALVAKDDSALGESIVQALGEVLPGVKIRSAADGTRAWDILCGGGVRFEDEAEGPGIPAGMEETIFKRFHRLKDAGDRHGAGLGLTISRQIVERHGGTLRVERGRGGGARFIADLPAGGGRSG